MRAAQVRIRCRFPVGDLVATHRMVEELTAEHAECPIDQNSLGVGDQCRTQTTVTHGRQCVASTRPPGHAVLEKIADAGVHPVLRLGDGIGMLLQAESVEHRRKGEGGARRTDDGNACRFRHRSAQA